MHFGVTVTLTRNREFRGFLGLCFAKCWRVASYELEIEHEDENEDEDEG